MLTALMSATWPGIFGACSTSASLVENRWLWLLDEPTTGLDIHAKELLREVVDEHRENGGSVVLVTHHRDVMEWLGATCHILKGGILQEVEA